MLGLGCAGHGALVVFLEAPALEAGPSLAAAMAPVATRAAGAQLRLLVPLPDWRDQILCFVMTDRFADGDPADNATRARASTAPATVRAARAATSRA